MRPFSGTAIISSGSNKWSKVRHKKAAADSARSNTFGRLTREIIAAIKAAGPSPETNARLALLLKKAKEVSFPKDRLEATLAKAQGGGSDGTQTVSYDVLASDGVAMIIECATDSPPRTHAKVKEIFNKSISGSARLSSVSHLFQRRGVVRVVAPAAKFDDVFEIALDAGAEDVRDATNDVESEEEEKAVAESNGDRVIVEILSEPGSIQPISQALVAAGYDLLEAEQRMLATGPLLRIKETEEHEDGVSEQQQTFSSSSEEEEGGFVDEETIRRLDRLVEALEESADCHRVWSNIKAWP